MNLIKVAIINEKRILSFYRKSNPWYYTCILFSLFITGSITGTGMFIPVFAINAISGQGNLNSNILILVILSLIFFICNLLKITIDNKFEKECFSCMSKLNKQLERQIMTCEYEKIEDPVTISRFENASDLLCGSDDEGFKGLSTINMKLVCSLVNSILCISILRRLSIWYVLICVAVNVLLFFLKQDSIKKITDKEKLARTANRELSYLYNRVCSLRAKKDITLYKAQNYINGKKEKVLNFKQKILKDVAWGKKIIGMWTECFRALLFIILFVYLAHKLVAEGMQISEYYLCIEATFFLSSFLLELLDEYSLLTKCSIEVSEIFDCLDKYPEIKDQGGHLTVSGSVSVTIKNLTFRYPDSSKDVLRGLSLEIKAGEKIALVGLNGSGKTTLIKIISGLYTIPSGHVFINDHDITTLSRQYLWSMIAPLFQDPFLVPGTIAQNINIQDKVTNFDEEQKYLDLFDLSSSMSLDTLIVHDADNSARDLSGGETQKVLMSRALFKDTPLLILDEPTSALDPISEKQFYELFSRMTAQKTCIFITHRLASTQFCSRILVMKDGQIVEEGTHEDLMSQCGEYAALYNTQKSLYQKGF